MTPQTHAHTPTPWKTGKKYLGIIEIYAEGKRGLVASARSEEDSSLIVRAVNAHDELLAAAKSALDWIIAGNDDGQPDLESPHENNLRSAIAKAEDR